MFTYGSNDLKRVSCIGMKTTIVLKNEQKIVGIIRQICDDHVCIFETKTQLETPWLYVDIDHFEFSGNGVGGHVTANEVLKIKNRIDKCANEAKITFSHLFYDEIALYSEKISNTILLNYIQTEHQHRAANYTNGEYEEFYSYLHQDREEIDGEDIGYNVINILLLCRMRSYDKAADAIINLMDSQLETYVPLLFTCFFSHLHTPIEALFWAEQYLKNILSKTSLENIRNNDVWWYYLRTSFKYASYESVFALLKKIAEFAPMTAVESVVYLLSCNNSIGLAVQVADYLDGSLTSDEALGIIERNDILSSDYDNNYHRFLRCIQEIFNGGELYSYNDDEYICGFVYDYIPDREYGFILGFDLLVYYFRKEEISEHVYTKIRRNICSMSSVEDEELVMVTFNRSIISKKSYNAVRIV